jgi:hypothetical protein
MAREDAARKAAMYHSTIVTLEDIQNIGSGFLEYYVSSTIQVEYDQQLESYMEKLSFDPDRDLVRNSAGVVFIRFSYPSVFPGSVNYRFGKNADGKPEWINQRPTEINGFMAGVGYSGRQSRLPDTVMKSCESAAASIASRVDTSISTRDISLQSQTGFEIYRKSTANLHNFMVLEIWIDPDTQAVWTLAIAQNAEIISE